MVTLTPEHYNLHRGALLDLTKIPASRSKFNVEARFGTIAPGEPSR